MTVCTKHEARAPWHTHASTRSRSWHQLFANQAVHADTLRSLTRQIAQLQGDLRLVHLQAQIEMKQLLVARANRSL